MQKNTSTMSRSSTPWIFLGCAGLSLLGFLFLGLLFLAALGSGRGQDGLSNPGIALVEVSGPISDEGVSGLVGGPRGGIREVIEDLEKARRDGNVKAIVLRVNSPGGSAAASQEMYNAVQRVRAAGKPVICSMGDVAASGGYYIAAACDKIYANGSTVTGSIGVISQFMNYAGLFKKVGLGETTIKSGKFKDAGNPSRNLTPAEKQLFQAMTMNIYNQFVNDVAKGRKGKLTRAQILKLADGRVYSGSQAKANKLIDEIGGLHEAVAEAAKRSGIQGEPKIVEMGKNRGLLGSMLGAEASTASNEAAATLGSAAGKSFADSMVKQMRGENTDIAPQLR